jgi:hypothetical protein
MAMSRITITRRNLKIYRLSTITLIIVFSLLSFGRVGECDSPTFDWDSIQGKLQINSSSLSLGFQNGAVVYLKDNVRNEVILDTDESINLPASTWDFIGFGSQDDQTRQPSRVPKETTATFTQNGSDATLTYDPCYTSGSPVSGTSLVYHFNINSNGDISITANATESAEGFSIQQMVIPIMNYAGSAVITGPNRIARGDASIGFGDFYGYAIPAAVIEGTNSSVGVWSENNNMQQSALRVIHNQNTYDHILLWDYPEPVQQVDDSQIMHSSTWKFTAQADWLGVAKRWRDDFEALNPDMKHLWENPVDWVRNIHTMYSRAHYINPSEWDNVAAIVPPTKTLIMPESDLSGQLVVFGDNDHQMTWVKPDSAERAYWTSQNYNYKVQGYYQPFYFWTNVDYELIHNPQAIPAGYTQPDDVGYDITASLLNQNQSVWDSYWSGLTAPYQSGTTLTQFHPGSTNAMNYINFNYPDFCSKTGVEATFWDILGGNEDRFFAAENNRVFNGKSYLMGQRDATEANYATYPIMGEWIVPGMLPYVWYWWQGAYNINNWEQAGLTPNHPFQTALMSSYSWTLGQRPASNSSPKYDALLGALPEFMLNNDYHADSAAPYSQAVAKLFAEDELWNDLPDIWDPDALAYYRTKYGTWMKAKEIETDDFGYYEEIPGMGDVLRLQESNPIVIPRPDEAYDSADLNQDGSTNSTDFNILKTDFLKLTANLANPRSDINGDGQATIRDVGIMMSGWQ